MPLGLASTEGLGLILRLPAVNCGQARANQIANDSTECTALRPGDCAECHVPSVA